MKKLLSFTLLLAAITMTGCLNQDKEESKEKEIVQTQKATRYAANYPFMRIREYNSCVYETKEMYLESDHNWIASGITSANGRIDFVSHYYPVDYGYCYIFGDYNKDMIAELKSSDYDGSEILINPKKSYIVTFNDVTKKYTVTPEQEGCYLRAYLPDGVSAISDMNYLKAEVYNSDNKLISTAKFRESCKFGCPIIDTYLESGYNTVKVDGIKFQPGEKYAKRYIVNFGITITSENILTGGPTFGDLPVTIQKVYFTSNYSQMYIRGTFNNWGNTMTYNYQTVPSKMGLIANNVWCAEITTTAAGSFKFDRDGNSSWTENYGDYTGDGIADRNGSNIAIPSAGVWKVTFNDQTKKYTLEKLN